MKKSLSVIVLLLAAVLLTAAIPSVTQAHWYGPGGGYYSYAYPSFGHVYGGPRGYVAWPGGRVYIGGYGGVYQPYPLYKSYRGRAYYGW